jgi:hypothetical protein
MAGEIFPPCLESQPSSMFSIKYMLTFAAVLAAAPTSETERIGSHRGSLSAAPDARAKDTFVYPWTQRLSQYLPPVRFHSCL